MQLDDFKLEVYFDRYEFSAKHLLAQSDCEAMTVAELLALDGNAEAMLQQTWLGYTEVAGNRQLREQAAGLYQGMQAEDLLCFCGAEEAIFAYMNTVLQPGDQVICMLPSYQSLVEIPRALGAEILPWRLQHQGQRWTLDLSELEELISAKTKLIVLNVPNNPTGFSLSTSQRQHLVKLASSHNIKIFSDEVYRGLSLEEPLRGGQSSHPNQPYRSPDGQPSPQSPPQPSSQPSSQPSPAFAEIYDQAVTLGVMSKAFGLAGLRVGWLVGRDHKLLSRIQRYKHYLSICNAGPSETLALIALRNADKLLARNIGIIRGNLSLADAFFSRHTGLFENIPPQAGSVAFHRLKLDGDGTDGGGLRGIIASGEDTGGSASGAAAHRPAASMAAVGSSAPSRTAVASSSAASCSAASTAVVSSGAPSRTAVASSSAASRPAAANIDSFCEQLVRESGVLLLPGSVFDHDGAYFRMGYGRRDFPDCLAALESYLNNII